MLNHKVQNNIRPMLNSVCRPLRVGPNYNVLDIKHLPGYRTNMWHLEAMILAFGRMWK